MGKHGARGQRGHNGSTRHACCHGRSPFNDSRFDCYLPGGLRRFIQCVGDMNDTGQRGTIHSMPSPGLSNSRRMFLHSIVLLPVSGPSLLVRLRLRASHASLSTKLAQIGQVSILQREIWPLWLLTPVGRRQLGLNIDVRQILGVGLVFCILLDLGEGRDICHRT